MGSARNVSSGVPRKATGGRVRPARLSKKDTGHKQEGPRPRKTTTKLVAVLDEDLNVVEEFDSVWESLGFSAEEAANLDMRSDLMRSLEQIIRSKRWTQAEAARRCGVSQPRMNDLLRGRFHKFSLDALVNMATALGQRVELHLKAA